MKLDVKIIENARRGDEQSFSALYESIWQDLYKTAFYILGNQEDAMDVVSETFMAAYRGIHQLRSIEAFSSWIYKILNTYCKKRIALYIKQRQNINIEEIFYEIPVEMNESADTRISLAAALAGLTVEERTIVVLSSVHGYTTKEIAQILHKPHGTICSKLSRTLKKVRKVMERE